MTGHIGINYTGKGKNGGYCCVEASVNKGGGNRITKEFASGDPASDFVGATIWLGRRDDVEVTMLSSSCDHFPHDVKGWGWYTNGVLGELIKPLADKGEWHKVIRLVGKNEGRPCFIQEGGDFVVLDNEDGIALCSPDGLVDPPKGGFATVETAMEYCKGLKRKVSWQ